MGYHRDMLDTLHLISMLIGCLILLLISVFADKIFFFGPGHTY